MGVGALSRAVFLDRDGVLNEVTVRAGVPHPPDGPEGLVILPGVAAACAALKALGFRLVVVTNQPDVARGTQRREVVDAIHARLRTLVPVDDIVACFHDDADACACRKPRPGMLLEAAARWQLDPGRSVMVGDRWVDVEAGRAAGCRTIYIDRGYGRLDRCHPDRIASDLPAAVPLIAAWEPPP